MIISKARDYSVISVMLVQSSRTVIDNTPGPVCVPITGLTFDI